MEQRTLKICDRVLYCYADGSIEFLRNSNKYKSSPLIRTFGSDNGNGYKQVEILINDKLFNLKIHRLIALAFHSNPNNLPQVDHINRNKADNRPSNLRWVSRKTNEENKDRVDQSVAKYGIRSCENRKDYDNAHFRHCLIMCKPDGRCTTSGALSPEVYNMLKPLSQRERYLKYSELKNL